MNNNRQLSINCGPIGCLIWVIVIIIIIKACNGEI